MSCCKENDSLLERVLRIAIISVVVLSMIFPVMDPRVFAASSVTISGGENVKGGDTFTVGVTFGGGTVGRVDGQLTYDTDRLTYISGGSSSGNSGYIQLSKAGTDGSVTFNIKFQAISEGNTVLEVTTNNMYDLKENSIDTVSGSKTISVSGSAAAGDIITQTESPDQPVAETELVGVDENTEESDADGANINLILIIVAAVLLILIVIIAIVLSRKKKASKNAVNDDHEDYYNNENDYYNYNDSDYNYDNDNSDYMSRTQRQARKKRANEETEYWGEWKGSDEGDEIK